MFKLICLFVVALVGCNCKCNLNEYNPAICVLQITDSNCLYDEFLNQCIETSNQNLGCLYNLNRNACINQLTVSGNIEKRCIFQDRCREVNIFHLKNLGCINSFSKYACLNVINKDCFWNGYNCQDSQQIILSDYSKEEIYPYSVTPQLCAKYHKYPCINTGSQGDYKCVTINYIQFKVLKCSALGLNQIGCVSILTHNEMCLFENYQCKTIKPSEIIECSQKINKLACLSITSPNLLCQWQQNECRTYKFDQQTSCRNIVDVNINVCANQEGLCRFDQLNYKCTEFNEKQLESLNCDTPGITKFACLSIQNQYCTFYQGFCQTLSENDLNNYQCQMQLNQAACINIKTKDQLCLWNGQGCQNVEITQDQDCNNFDKFLVNGNVCQAITKPNAMCKYDEITKICIQSSTNDYCTTPYLNLYGCVSISRENQICKWIDSSCQDIVIIPFKTLCSSLEYANYQACQQVFENNQMGCYYDKIKYQCVSLSTDNENNINPQEIQKANQFLATVSCFDITLGLNKIICGSITTENIFCRWQQNSCKIVKKDAIANIPCTDLIYTNPSTCALVKYNNEFCRYFKEEKGCTNQLKGEMNCNDLGLNTISCNQAKENCYFQNDKCQSIGEISTSITPEVQIILQKLECFSNFPTQNICLAIQTQGQLCTWSNKYQQCREVLVPQNKKCSDFSSFQVNANVCAIINLGNIINIILDTKISFDQDPSYCEYDRQENNCREKIKKCTSKCCTENEELGINSYSCSRFSNQDPGVYCYFQDFRCQQLTNQIVDISNPNIVKSYYNEKKFTCAQMTKNSCHMIDWSTSQACYYNGFACVNLNLQNHFDFLELTKSSAIVSKYVCLAIEVTNSVNQSQKYIEYNQEGKNCKFLQQPYPQYQTCESVIGNSNICLGLTSNLYCKWNQEKLKCVTITLDQSQEIFTCNEYQNIKSCIENQYSACQFSLAQDKCINAPLDQDCSYFNTTGKVSKKTCSLITKKGQICEFQNNYCVVSTKSIEGCNLEGINKRGCYKNTKGNCRWDDVSGQCYENKTALLELECNNNLNQILCMKVTKQPCMWNDDQYQCVYFNQMTKDQYVEQNPKNQYNQWACTLIVGAGYTFDEDNHKCKILDDTQNFGCSDIWMNNYACQFLTKSYYCYFDQNEKPPKCKIFNMDQTICSSKYAINIEVCMNIPKSCKFSLLTMSCETLIVNQDVTCLDLQGLQNKGEYINKLGCSSISESLQGNDGEQQCYQNEELSQKCNYQKFCLWNNYTCKVSKQQIFVFDNLNYIINEQSYWEFKKNNCTSNTDCNPFIIKPEFNDSGLTYPGVSQNLKCGLRRCDYTNEPCSSKTDCQDISIENLQVNDDGSIKQPKMQVQTCQSTCQQSLTVQECNSSEIPPKEVLQPANIQYQLCQGRCNNSKIICESNTCGEYLKFPAVYENYTDANNKTQTSKISDDIYETDQCNLESFTCSQNGKSCTKESDCLPFVVRSWEFQDAICKKYYVYTKFEICKGFVYLQLKCQNIFSKALCLQMTNENCFFDLNQGGCIQLEGNEDKVPNCDSIKNTKKPTNQCDNFTNICRFSGQQQNEYQNTCQAVSSKYLNCEDGGEQNVADDQCLSNTQSYKNCVKSINFQISSCLKVSNPSILNCAGVADYCRYQNGACISDQNSYPCKCDKSFSKSWCEYCNCNYDLLGYCQTGIKPIQKLPDNSNQYYLCYQVNLLPIETENKKKVCGMVEQACRYTFTCEDATHFSCDYLLNFVVSKTACIRCNSLSVYYNEQQQFCLLLDGDIKSCDLLNKQACLQNTKEIKCKWEEYECKQIDKITGFDSRDCSIYNEDACIQLQQDCWFDLNIGYCTQFDPTQGSCNLLLNEDLCLFSLKESCLWDSINQKCIKNDKELQQCSDLNKFGCLNQSILSCVWSDLYKCQQINAYNNASSCDSPLQNNQNSYITHFSQKICSQLKIQSNCFLDNYYQCRETIITDLIKCDTKGLNKFGCINRSIGQCQFIDEQVQCIENKDDQIGCLDSLNKWACISQKQTCKFDNNICSLHSVNTINDIINSTLKFAYSKSVCYALDQKITDCLIYSELQNRCINVSNRQPFIDNCYKFITNKYACLQKTLQTCEYNSNENSCIKTSQQTLKTFNNCFSEKDLNWVSCISLPSNCKFNGMKCQSIDLKIDTCESLSKSKYIVKASVCATTNDRNCKLNINSNTCEIVLETDNFQCSIPGLNKRSCLFQTKGYLCRFQDDQCIFDFGFAQCEDMINEDKCYSIKTKGQYCTFDLSKGCYSIDNSQGELLKCIHSFKTNPITCSKSIDIPCFYDQIQNECISFLDIKEQYQSPNLNWNNKISFNSLMCQRYSQENIKVFWKIQDNQEECIEVQDAELKNLKCSDQLNEISCINIQTPFEFCQYENFTCKSINLDSPQINRICSYYQKVNSGAFCSITTDNPCEYDWRNKRCQVLIEPFEVDCNYNPISNKWYNEAACMKNLNCIFQDGNCQQKTDKSITFCQDTESNEIKLCQEIITQGCSVLSDSCVALLPISYQATKCKETVYKEGCIQIQIPKQTCQNNQNKDKCRIEDENFDFKSTCLKLMMNSINYSQYCEQIADQSCKYNETINKCEIATENNYDCIRGLNQMACNNLTDKSLQCKYLNHCYGPNDKILGCNPKNQYDCCREASTKESCLFQTQFYCQWQNGCQAFQQTSQKECNQIKDASVIVCRTIQDSFCIFDSENFNCKQITPGSCDEIQTSDQCNQITEFPCIWDEINETCNYKEKDIFDQCNNIRDKNGNLKACTMIERSGQKCIFLDNQCKTFYQKEGINNCSNNLNIISCLQQNVSQCEWVIKEVQVKKRKDITNFDIIKIGECQQFTDFDNRDCNLLLSQKSCISIRKLGQFCRWKNNQCQNFYLSYYLSDKNIQLELAQIVNPNVCGLYQDQRLISYSQELTSCIEVKDSSKLSCKYSKYGLNSVSCFKIQSELCKWNHIQKTCEEVTITNTNFTISCDLPGLNSKACTLIEVNDSCGFIGNGCGKIDFDVNCKHQGLNKFACLKILNYPCAWIKNEEDDNYHCDDYQPFDTCNNINLQVTSMVCSSVQIDACFYNKETQSCETPKETLDNCDIEGLNYIACSKIKGCFYQNNKCQALKEESYNCLKYPKAHQDICKNAYDLCKYSPLNYGCIPSQSNEICKREGLSQTGCVKSQNKCFWNKNNCECLSIQNVYPFCDQIVESQKCQKFKSCIYYYQRTNNNEVNKQIENQNLGICKQKRCSDLNNQECQEFNIFNLSCYLSNENQCKQANSCEEVKNSYEQCSSLVINGIPCIQSSSDQKSCKKLVCSELDKVMCSKLSNYCIYVEFCQTKQCQELQLEYACRYYNCEWNKRTKQCRDKLKCESYQTEQGCNQSTFNSIQCSWLTDNSQSFCGQNGCDYFLKRKGQSCRNKRIQNNFCVSLQDDTCLQCEEIKDSCLCIDQEYCRFDYYLSQCQSINCNYLIKEECQQFNFCQFNSEKKACHFNCANYDNLLDCSNNSSNCEWNDEQNSCTQSQVQIIISKIPDILIVEWKQLISACILVWILF